MDDNNIIDIKDGDPTRLQIFEAPSLGELTKPKFEGIKKKRRRGKFKRKLSKPFIQVPFQEKRINEKPKRNRFRKIVLAKTQAPFNNNQFLMEIHKPEPENSFDIMHTPSARTRDSSFSIDSEDNYFYALPEDEEEYLTKEFSSVYEDAQCERLSNMSKNELIQEYLLLEAKYDNLLKRTERYKQKATEDENSTLNETSVTDKESMVTDKDISGTSHESNEMDEPSYSELLQKLKAQEEQLGELLHSNEKLRLENEHLHKKPQGLSSEDSESDSSSSSGSDSSSSASDVDEKEVCDNAIVNEAQANGQNGETNNIEQPLVNGFHSPNE